MINPKKVFLIFNLIFFQKAYSSVTIWLTESSALMLEKTTKKRRFNYNNDLAVNLGL